MLTGTDPQLLRRDNLALDTVAAALRLGARFVVVAASQSLRDLARAYLADATGLIFDEVLLDTSPTLAPTLSAKTPAPPDTVVALSMPSSPELLATLNLHREKLHAPGARFLLWLHGAEGFSSLVQEAPDAYSFRDAVAVLQAMAEPVAFATGEPSSLRRAREAVVRASPPMNRASALRDLAEGLVKRGDFAGSEAAVAEGLDLLSDAGAGADARTLRARLRFVRSRIGDYLQRWQEKKAALNELGSPPSWGENLWALLQGQLSVPLYRFDLNGALRVLDAAEHMTFGSPGSLAVALQARGDLTGAIDSMRYVSSSTPYNRAVAELRGAEVKAAVGRWTEAEQSCRRASAQFGSLGASDVHAASELFRGELMAKRGECQAARRIVESLDVDGLGTDKRVRCLLLEARLAATETRVDEAEKTLRAAMGEALLHGEVYRHHEVCEALARFTRDAYAAGLRDENAPTTLDNELQAAQEVAVQLAGDEPPWYSILYRDVRAEHLASHDISGAIDLQRQSWDIAQSGWPELAARSGRRLATWLLDDQRYNEALEIVDHALSLAKDFHLFEESARLHGVRARATLDSAEQKTFREAALTTGSRKLVAEIYLDHAPAIGATKLLETALMHFRDLPWPENEGRCLEALGRPNRAAAVYRRFGLELRLRMLMCRRTRRWCTAPVDAESLSWLPKS